MAIDPHMHLNSMVKSEFNIDSDNEIKRISDNGDLSCVINVGLNVETSRESVQISNCNNKFYSAIGIHPLYIQGENVDDLCNLVNDRVVAIGEIGLDKNKDNFYEQRRYLIEQLVIANTFHLPVIIHSNNSNKEVIEIFEKFIKPKYGCVFHCYQPEIEYLDYIIKNEFYISFAGRITYKNARKSIEVLNKIPNELYIVETDSPYISPEPVRNNIGSSSYIKYIYRRIAELKNTTQDEIEQLSDNNIRTLFNRIQK